MTAKGKSAVLWIFAVIFTISIAIYQRMTGPTYPLKGKIEINNSEIKYKLLRSADCDGPARIIIKNIPEGVTGMVKYKRFNVAEEYTLSPLEKEENNLVALLPEQPPAGKLEYFIELNADGERYTINEQAVVIRFKGVVPSWILIPHIILMFFAMLFSTRTGIEAIFRGRHALKYALVTVITLFFGGLVLGPIVQEYAFGDYWTGWPFGHDLTDNKTLVAFVFWVIAYVRLRKNPGNRLWPILACTVLLLVYLIPHSMFGSQLDYTSGEVTTGK